MSRKIRKFLALFATAMSISACGADDGVDSDEPIAGGQTGGEGRHANPPPTCSASQKSEIAFTAPGPSGASVAEIIEKLSDEHRANGLLDSQTTEFRSRITYAGRAESGCGMLFIATEWQLSTDNGAFAETLPATLEVTGDFASIGVTVRATDLKGAYRTSPQLALAELKFAEWFLSDGSRRGTVQKILSTSMPEPIGSY